MAAIVRMIIAIFTIAFIVSYFCGNHKRKAVTINIHFSENTKLIQFIKAQFQLIVLIYHRHQRQIQWHCNGKIIRSDHIHLMRLQYYSNQNLSNKLRLLQWILQLQTLIFTSCTLQNNWIYTFRFWFI